MPVTPACLGYNKGLYEPQSLKSSGRLCPASLSLEVLKFSKSKGQWSRMKLNKLLWEIFEPQRKTWLSNF